MNNNKNYASFRDPSGYVYYEDGKVLRKINKCYIETYDYLMSSGLYNRLVEEELIIKHKEVERTDDFVILEMEKVSFISYSYEWCFLQYKDAALLTLKINMIALEYGMVLKDASAYNVQFVNSKPIFIDTLSFEIYKEGMAWGAYGQFTRHFIAPLLLMNYVDERMNCLLKNYIDGIPLDLTEAILKKRGGFFSKQHIIWQNKAIKKHNIDGNNSSVKVNLSKKSLVNINVMIQSQIESLRGKKVNTEWNKYYNNTNYSSIAHDKKKSIVLDYVKKININRSDLAIDMGANDGKYSRIISEYFNMVISMDIDNNVVNRNYEIASKNSENILPLVFDFNNPSPSIGFACKERDSFDERCPVKLVMSLALIHHIAISNNVPIDKIAEWFAKSGEYLIIEFVPKNDSQVELLLRTRIDIFDMYTKECFEEEFSRFFDILEKNNVLDSERIIYLMKVKK